MHHSLFCLRCRHRSSREDRLSMAGLQDLRTQTLAHLHTHTTWFPMPLSQCPKFPMSSEDTCHFIFFWYSKFKRKDCTLRPQAVDLGHGVTLWNYSHSLLCIWPKNPLCKRYKGTLISVWLLIPNSKGFKKQMGEALLRLLTILCYVKHCFLSLQAGKPELNLAFCCL